MQHRLVLYRLNPGAFQATKRQCILPRVAPSPDASTDNTAFPAGGIAVIIGSSWRHRAGDRKPALTQSGGFSTVVGLNRRSTPPLELTDETSIAAAAAHVAGLSW